MITRIVLMLEALGPGDQRCMGMARKEPPTPCPLPATWHAQLQVEAGNLVVSTGTWIACDGHVYPIAEVVSNEEQARLATARIVGSLGPKEVS